MMHIEKATTMMMGSWKGKQREKRSAENPTQQLRPQLCALGVKKTLLHNPSFSSKTSLLRRFNHNCPQLQTGQVTGAEAAWPWPTQGREAQAPLPAGGDPREAPATSAERRSPRGDKSQKRTLPSILRVHLLQPLNVKGVEFS